MENKKYELVMDDTITFNGRTLYRVRALKNFAIAFAGSLGGYIEGYHNLSQDGECWVYDGARVYDNAMVYDDALVCDSSIVYDNAKVYDTARICNDSLISGQAKIHGFTIVHDRARISNNADISSDKDYLCVKGLGSENRLTTIFRLSGGGIYVNCGCFKGTLDEFKSAVKNRYVYSNSKYRIEYELLIQMAKVHFDLV